jgi:cobalt-zinc-cadmium efflux system protein
MLGIAAGGLLVNLLGMAILHSGKSESLNIHGAWLHLLTDALGSVAALVAGALIWSFGWYAADPIASVLIGILIIYSSWHLVMQAISILMERTPGHLDVDAVRNAMLSADGILEVHDLHIWTITSGMESLSAHVVLAAGFETYDALDRLRDLLHEQFGIDHITIQIEPEGPARCRNSF